MAGRRMAGLLNLISKTFVTTHVEIACVAFAVACTLVDSSLIYLPLRWKQTPSMVYLMVSFIPLSW